MKTFRILCEDGDSGSIQVSLRLFVLERGSAHSFPFHFLCTFWRRAAKLSSHFAQPRSIHPSHAFLI